MFWCEYYKTKSFQIYPKVMDIDYDLTFENFWFFIRSNMQIQFTRNCWDIILLTYWYLSLRACNSEHTKTGNINSKNEKSLSRKPVTGIVAEQRGLSKSKKAGSNLWESFIGADQKWPNLEYFARDFPWL